MAVRLGDPQAAFRAGVLGRELALMGRPAEATGEPRGANESIVAETERLPGLSDPRGAWETGRVLRLVARLFDEARAPARISEQFRDNLAAAIAAHRMRKIPRAWDAEDTVSMFMEMYSRVLGADEGEIGRVSARLLRDAREAETTDDPAAPTYRNPFRRPRE